MLDSLTCVLQMTKQNQSYVEYSTDAGSLEWSRSLNFDQFKYLKTVLIKLKVVFSIGIEQKNPCYFDFDFYYIRWLLLNQEFFYFEGNVFTYQFLRTGINLV